MFLEFIICMMESLNSIIKKNLFKKINSVGLSVFRILYSSILFVKVFELFSERELIYTGVDLNVDYVFLFWFPVLILLILGLFTRIASVLNYIFTIILFSSAIEFEYTTFYAFVGINLLFIFLPISRSISLDSLVKKLKYSTLHFRFKNDENVFAVNYLFPVFTAITLLYIDSVVFFFKLNPSNGFSLNGVVEMWNELVSFLNNDIYSYTLLLFQLIFILFFWFKPFRIPLLILGVIFHLGIALFTPFFWFSLKILSVYSLMIPIRFWSKFFTLFKSKRSSFTFYYDLECPLCAKIIIIINHFDVFNKIQCLPVQIHYNSNPALTNISLDELLINIHSVNSKGHVFVGYNSYVQLLKQMIWTWPFGFLLNLPVLKAIGQGLYKKIAGNRLTERCTEENCSIPVISLPIKEDEDILIKGLSKSAILMKFWLIFFYLMLFFLITKFVRF